jgi:hypothetical protein
MEQVKALQTLDDPLSLLPFVHEILSSLRCGICLCRCAVRNTWLTQHSSACSVAAHMCA